MISQKTRISLAQFLTLQEQSFSSMLLIKHRAARSVEDGLAGIERACREISEGNLLELIREIAATAGDLRNRVSPRYRFDERYDDLKQCLSGDGIEVDGATVTKAGIIDPFSGGGSAFQRGRPFNVIVTDPPYTDARAEMRELGKTYDFGSITDPVTHTIDLGTLPSVPDSASSDVAVSVDIPAVAAALADVRAVVEAVLNLQNGQIGHNNPPGPIDPPPLSTDDIDICIQAVNVYRTVTSSYDHDVRTLLRTIVVATERRMVAFKEWIERQSIEFVDTINTNCGKLLAEGFVRGFGGAAATAVVGGALLLLSALLRVF